MRTVNRLLEPRKNRVLVSPACQSVLPGSCVSKTRRRFKVWRDFVRGGTIGTIAWLELTAVFAGSNRQRRGPVGRAQMPSADALFDEWDAFPYITREDE